ncbi:MAG: polymerase [Treponema sp.]|jgi:hypothetical protein|nr:polymerase [Treponema sp.]
MKNRQKTLLIITFILLCTAGLAAQVRFDVSSSVDWMVRELDTKASFDLAPAGIRLPTGRSTGEEILRQAYARLVRDSLLPIRVDSNSTIQDLVNRGEISMGELELLCREAEKTAPSLSLDLSQMTGRYKVFMEKISARLMSHRRAVEPPRPLIPARTAEYTGIIIIANEELPVHGRMSRALVVPCLFPKIWDTSMELVYERNMFDPTMKEESLMVRYTTQENIFRATPSGLEGELAALVGPNPLRIFAREVFGIAATDPVIDREDALKILSTENNRRLLREGRVVFVLNEKTLNEYR